MLAKTPRATRETVSSLARSVGQGSQLQSTEAALEELRKRQSALAAEQDAHCRAHRDGKAVSLKVIQAYDPELADLRDQITSRRAELSKLRLARAGRVADQLSGLRKEAAARAIAALQELDEASEILITCCDELRFAGDHDAPYLNMVPSFSMREHANRILGK